MDWNIAMSMGALFWLNRVKIYCTLVQCNSGVYEDRRSTLLVDQHWS